MIDLDTLRKAKGYVLAIVDESTGEYKPVSSDIVQVIRCKDCEYHGKRTNICDIFHCHTNPNGYCHRGRIYGQTESCTESK